MSQLSHPGLTFVCLAVHIFASTHFLPGIQISFSEMTPPTDIFRNADCRTLVLELTVMVGEICNLVLQTVPYDKIGSTHVGSSKLCQVSAAIISTLHCLCQSTGLALEQCIWKKIALNKLKYPVSLCKVRTSAGSGCHCYYQNLYLTDLTVSPCVFATREKQKNTPPTVLLRG